MHACTSMEHAHVSYANMILKKSLTHWVKLKPKFYVQILHQKVIKPTKSPKKKKEKKNSKLSDLDSPLKL